MIVKLINMLKSSQLWTPDLTQEVANLDGCLWLAAGEQGLRGPCHLRQHLLSDLAEEAVEEPAHLHGQHDRVSLPNKVCQLAAASQFNVAESAQGLFTSLHS